MPVNPFFAVEPPQDAAPTAAWIVEPRGRSLQRLRDQLTPFLSAGLAPVKRTSQSYGVERPLSTRSMSSTGSDFDKVILLRALSQHEEPPLDRITRTEPRSLVGDATVVGVDAAAPNESRCLALRRGQSA